MQSVCAKCRFSGKNNFKEVVKLFKENSKCYLKFDISKFVNTHLCACVVFSVVKLCVGFVMSEW